MSLHNVTKIYEFREFDFVKEICISAFAKQKSF